MSILSLLKNTFFKTKVKNFTPPERYNSFQNNIYDLVVDEFSYGDMPSGPVELYFFLDKYDSEKSNIANNVLYISLKNIFKTKAAAILAAHNECVESIYHLDIFPTELKASTRKEKKEVIKFFQANLSGGKIRKINCPLLKDGVLKEKSMKVNVKTEVRKLSVPPTIIEGDELPGMVNRKK